MSRICVLYLVPKAIAKTQFIKREMASQNKTKQEILKLTHLVTCAG